ncbi:MAG: asparaginase [Anaerolineae bacterium CG_4_9_14_3_um_filter_57_17]|nr:MAG: asparaginase [Anaerolineae bacterium CG_4_9_14_3_um_filter_57_17]
MVTEHFEPVFELIRGKIVESVHYGAAAIVDSHGRLLAWLGDPQTVTFLRSTAKPFQALPFIERGGHEKFGLTAREIALICASHSGTDEHVAAVKTMQAKIGVTVDDLKCGFHYPYHEATADAMKARGELPTPYRHNCSGKHTGMLAHAKLRGLPIENYLDLDHPVQVSILQTFAEMCDLPQKEVELGIDGCSAPNFADPLYNAALGYARLCDPFGLSAARTQACRTITSAMTHHPDMVGGPERFDTRLMEVGRGRIVVKGGAEGYQGIGLLPGALGADSPGIGIAIKISDGDSLARARHGVGLAILQALGALNAAQLAEMSSYGPGVNLYNFRKLQVGFSRPAVKLQKA